MLLHIYIPQATLCTRDVIHNKPLALQLADSRVQPVKAVLLGGIERQGVECRPLVQVGAQENGYL
jgi:hypothetical protein